MTFTEMESRIRSIALKSSKFKIGKSGQHKFERLKQHGLRRIEIITFSKHKRDIDEAEAKMIDIFINWKHCGNKRGGSAGRMSAKSTKYVLKYILYVIYSLKKR